MSPRSPEQKAKLKQRVVHELEEYLAVTLFLLFFFGSIVTYRRLILAEYDIAYFEYGWALLKALILGKVILIGELLHLGERFRDRPLLLSILWKTLAFALLIVAFGILEHAVSALVHHRPLASEFQFTGPERYELFARVQLEAVGLVPLVAFLELGRVLGEGKLHALLFRGPAAAQRVDAKT
jgi:hypothetical protein